MDIDQEMKGTTQMMGAYGLMGGFGGLGMLVGVLVWLAVIVLFVWGLGSVFGRSTGDPRGEALDTLRQRYAAGEITSAEFETARRALAA
jgi:uncharacterized membrane protein